MLAVEFGEKYDSCSDAMEQRRALGADATQSDWWKVCDRGDWLLWQLEQEGLHINNPAIERAVERIVARAIRRGIKSLHGIRAKWATKWRRWARGWLSGENRTARAARAAWGAARAAWAAKTEAKAWEAKAWARVAWEAEAWARAARAAEAWARVVSWAAWAAELKLQARDIRREIPEWPGGQGKGLATKGRVR